MLCNRKCGRGCMAGGLNCFCSRRAEPGNRLWGHSFRLWPWQLDRSSLPWFLRHSHDPRWAGVINAEYFDSVYLRIIVWLNAYWGGVGGLPAFGFLSPFTFSSLCSLEFLAQGMFVLWCLPHWCGIDFNCAPNNQPTIWTVVHCRYLVNNGKCIGGVENWTIFWELWEVIEFFQVKCTPGINPSCA